MIRHRGYCIIYRHFFFFFLAYRHIYVVVIVVSVLTLTRIFKSVLVTGQQAPVTLELRNTPEKNTNKPKVVHAYIKANAYQHVQSTGPVLQETEILLLA